jgi:hypothetical protein
MRMNDRRRHRETMRRTTDSTTSVRSGANTGAGSLAAGDAFSRVRLRQWKTACWRRRLRCVATRTEASEQSPADDATSRSITVSDCLAYHAVRLLGVPTLVPRDPSARRTPEPGRAARRLSRILGRAHRAPKVHRDASRAPLRRVSRRHGVKRTAYGAKRAAAWGASSRYREAEARGATQTARSEVEQ